MRITLNLASRPYADQGPALKRLRIGMAALVVVLAGLSVGLMHFHQTALKMAAQEDALDQSIARIGREEQGYQAQMRQPANAKVLTQAMFLNQLFDEKSFSWTAAMEDLERVLPPGVQVTAIEPVRAKDGRLTLRLRISGQRERSVEMVRNMERSARFAAPRISGENSEAGNSQGDLQPVRDTGRVSFEVLAEYNPATLDERKAEIAAHGRGRAEVRSDSVSAPVPEATATRVSARQPQVGIQSHPGYIAPNPQPAGARGGYGNMPPQNPPPVPLPNQPHPPTGGPQ
jgi:type IV pilus assembly protein PilN